MASRLCCCAQVNNISTTQERRRDNLVLELGVLISLSAPNSLVRRSFVQVGPLRTAWDTPRKPATQNQIIEKPWEAVGPAAEARD